ncbi:5'-3' exonuclease [Pseudomonas phage vB_PaeP_P1G]|uniref:5'-3' exonuclease n=1 Tax=Pseudomonas phage vB_PaeP_P1G TaxID=3025372 RepID=A0AAE9YA94_9CAUD|nr:5'-3' exonuclease [Pseudomonas phage vB_PaeP_P1G]
MRLPSEEFLAGLSAQFDRSMAGGTLVCDADGPAYVAAATAKTLDTALRRFWKLILEQQFLAHCTGTRVHLTAAGGAKAYRDTYPTMKPYQGQRKGKAKPALLEPLRRAVADVHERGGAPEGIDVILHTFFEADDGMMMDAYAMQDKAIIRSDDKDLRMTIYPYWEIDTACVSRIEGGFGYLKEAYTPSGQFKLKGHGRKFFLAQWLGGDTADNIRGIDRFNGKLCGMKTAFDILHPITDEDEAIDMILEAYAKIKQNPLAEAEVLWMRRTPTDNAAQYLLSRDLRPAFRQWIIELDAYHEALLQKRREGDYDE